MPASQQPSATRLARSIEKTIADAALDCLWKQWRILGASATAATGEEARSMIDPEALVLFSLYMRDRERRLDDFLGWWSGLGSRLLGVQRMQNLAQRFPDGIMPQLSAFASLALDAGDRRWTTLAAKDTDIVVRPRKSKGSDAPALEAAPALMLRLRAGFGVSAKADLLALLLGMAGAAVTTTEAADAIGYTEVAVRSAAQEMLTARFIMAAPGDRARYRVEPSAWGELLGLTPPQRKGSTWPIWRDWGGVFPLLASLLGWTDSLKKGEWSEYVCASRLRDVIEEHAATMTTLGAALPRTSVSEGAGYLHESGEAIGHVAGWVGRNT